MISIVIPTHNRARLLERTLDSLQPYPDSEIIVVDNASTDDTAAVVARYPHVQRIFEPVPSVSRARNAGAAAARGEVVLYLDDDCVVEPKWFDTVYRVYREESARPLSVGGRVVLTWEVPQPSWLSDAWLTLLSAVDLGDTPRPCNPAEYLFGCSMAFDRPFLTRQVGFNPRLGRSRNSLISNEELVLQIEIRRRNGVVLYHPDVLVYHWVPRHRVRFWWFVRRQFDQGRSDAISNALLEPERVADSLSWGQKWQRFVASQWYPRNLGQWGFLVAMLAAYRIGRWIAPTRP